MNGGAFLLPFFQFPFSNFNFQSWAAANLLRSCAALLDFRCQISIHQCRAPMQSGTNLQRRDSGSSPQVRTRQVRAIQFHSSQNRARQKSPSQIRFLQIGVKEDRAFQNRAGEIRFSKPG